MGQHEPPVRIRRPRQLMIGEQIKIKTSRGVPAFAPPAESSLDSMERGHQLWRWGRVADGKRGIDEGRIGGVRPCRRFVEPRHSLNPCNLPDRPDRPPHRLLRRCAAEWQA